MPRSREEVAAVGPVVEAVVVVLVVEVQVEDQDAQDLAEDPVEVTVAEVPPMLRQQCHPPLSKQRRRNLLSPSWALQFWG